MTSISLFHGTTADAATEIQRHGFVGPDPMSLIDEVSAEFDVPSETLLSDLRTHGAHLTREKGRGSWVSFTPKFGVAAMDWAQRAPEARRELLWAVWRLRYSTQPDTSLWNVDVAGHDWVLERLSVSAPVVLEFETSVKELLELRACRGGSSHQLLTPEVALMADMLPEVALPLPLVLPAKAVTVHQVPRCVGFDVLARRLGVSVDELRSLEESGRLGSPGTGAFEVMPWWPLDSVEALLNPDS